jgi:cobalt/nickel transport protein
LKSLKIVVLAVLTTWVVAGAAGSHFGMLIPSDSMVMQNDDRTLTVALSFSHPFEMTGMELVKPKAFDVVVGGKRQDLSGSLATTKVMDRSAWKAKPTCGSH